MKLLKRFSMLLMALLMALCGVFAYAPIPAKASATYTLTLQYGSGGTAGGSTPELLLTNLTGFTASTLINLTNKGNFAEQINDVDFQEIGSTSTYYLDFTFDSLPVSAPQELGNQIDLITTDSATLVSTIAGWTANSGTKKWTHWGTPCGGSVTHTTSQSDAWHNFGDGTHAEAEWSGVMKYTPPGGGSCDIHIYYSLGAGTPWFRPSTTDAHYAQWPSTYTDCPFLDYSTDHKVKCTYAAINAQLSHRVKLFSTPTSFTTSTFVTVQVYEKDSVGDYIPLANPSNVTGWAFN